MSEMGPLTFPQQLVVVADDLFMLEFSMQSRVLRKCWEKSKNSEYNSIFANKTAGRGRVKPGSGPQISVLPRTFG